MALIETEIIQRGDKLTLRLRAPDMPHVDIKLPLENKTQTYEAIIGRDVIHGVSCGVHVTAWIQQYLGREDVAMIYCDSDEHLRIIQVHTEDLPQWVEGNVREDDKTGYAYFSQILLINDTSVDHLNDKISENLGQPVEKPISNRNFRPNIVIRTPKAFDEDKFKRVFIGTFEQETDLHSATSALSNQRHISTISSELENLVADEASVVLRKMKPCQRCALTVVDPDLGKRRPDNEPLKTLRQFRLHPDFGNAPLFGINLAPERTGPINVGDLVFAVLDEN